LAEKARPGRGAASHRVRNARAMSVPRWCRLAAASYRRPQTDRPFTSAPVDDRWTTPPSSVDNPGPDVDDRALSVDDRALSVDYAKHHM